MSEDDKRVDVLQIDSDFPIQPDEVGELAKRGAVADVTYIADLEDFSITIKGGKQKVHTGKATKVKELSFSFENASLQDYLSFFARLQSMGCQVNFSGAAGKVGLAIA